MLYLNVSLSDGCQGYPPHLVLARWSRRTIHTVKMSSYYGNDQWMHWTGILTSPDIHDDRLPLETLVWLRHNLEEQCWQVRQFTELSKWLNDGIVAVTLYSHGINTQQAWQVFVFDHCVLWRVLGARQTCFLDRLP